RERESAQSLTIRARVGDFLLDDGHDVAGAHRLTGLDPHVGDPARPFGVDVVLHLHGLEDAHGLAHLHLVTDAHEDLHDRALHGHGDLAGARRAATPAARRRGARPRPHARFGPGHGVRPRPPTGRAHG